MPTKEQAETQIARFVTEEEWEAVRPLLDFGDILMKQTKEILEKFPNAVFVSSSEDHQKTLEDLQRLNPV